jgi:hypothetical protein
MAVRPNRYRRLHRYADALLEGPDFIRPPVSWDRFGYLTRAVSIRLRLATPVPGRRIAIYRDPQQSIAIYTDDTVNRADRFLPPLIRYASWDRLKNLPVLNETDSPWPAVDVSLGTIVNRKVTLAFIGRLQRRLRRLPFVPYFSARRGIPPIRGNGIIGEMSLLVRNGAQAVEYRAPTSGPDQGLARLAIAGLQCFREQMKPLPLRGWKEFYSFTPATGPMDTDMFWTYRYKRPTWSEAI